MTRTFIGSAATRKESALEIELVDGVILACDRSQDYVAGFDPAGARALAALLVAAASRGEREGEGAR